MWSEDLEGRRGFKKSDQFAVSVRCGLCIAAPFQLIPHWLLTANECIDTKTLVVHWFLFCPPSQDIIGIDFGTSSSAFLWSLQAVKGGKGSASEFSYPWRCFTVRTLKDTYEFRAKSDEVAQE